MWLSPFHSLYFTNWVLSPKNISNLGKAAKFYVYLEANTVSKIISITKEIIYSSLLSWAENKSSPFANDFFY